MFEEPVRIGLIRFADAYDQRAQFAPIVRGSPLGGPTGPPRQERERRRRFDADHQPLLVIYTTAAEAEPGAPGSRYATAANGAEPAERSAAKRR